VVHPALRLPSLQADVMARPAPTGGGRDGSLDIFFEH